jgi:hypothetical protein
VRADIPLEDSGAGHQVRCIRHREVAAGLAAGRPEAVA